MKWWLISKGIIANLFQLPLLGIKLLTLYFGIMAKKIQRAVRKVKELESSNDEKTWIHKHK